MPHPIDEFTGDKLVPAATEPAPFGPGFTPGEVSEATRMEVWGSSFKDDGDDYCEFRLFKDNELIATRRVEGY